MPHGPVAALWRELHEWIAAHQPRLSHGLNGPAGAADLDALRGVDLALPDALFQSLAIHDGEDDSAGDGLFGGGLLLSARGQIEHYAMQQQALASLAGLPSAPQPTLGPVKPLSFSPHWWPILDLNGDVSWYLDFDPAEGGMPGQVIRVDLEAGEWAVCAAGYAEFLAAFLADLRAGLVFDAAGDPLDETPWPPLERLPVFAPGHATVSALEALIDLGHADLVAGLMDRAQPPLASAQRLRLGIRAAQARGDEAAALALLDELAASGEETGADALVRIDVLEQGGHLASALSAVEAALARHGGAEPHVRRARLVLAMAQRTPQGGRHSDDLRWFASPAGQQAAATARERALADFDAAIAQRPERQWRLDRAELLLDSERWDEAQAELVALIEAIGAPATDSDAAWELPRAEHLLERAQRRGEGESEELMKTLDEVLANLGDALAGGDSGPLEELREMRETFADLMQTEAREREARDASPGALAAVAQDVADRILRQHADTPERFGAFDAAALPARVRRWYDRARDALAALGFAFCADVEPLRNTEVNGRRVLLRLMLSGDFSTVAAVWRLEGPFSAYEVVDLESELADGRILLTSNSGSANPFQSPAPIETLALPLDTGVAPLAAAHRARLPAREAIVPIPDLDAILALQERQRVLKRAAARERGWISDAELRGLLGAGYGELAGPVRAALARMG